MKLQLVLNWLIKQDYDSWHKLYDKLDDSAVNRVRYTFDLMGREEMEAWCYAQPDNLQAALIDGTGLVVRRAMVAAAYPGAIAAAGEDLSELVYVGNPAIIRRLLAVQRGA